MFAMMNLANTYNAMGEYKKAIDKINQCMKEAEHPKMFYHRGYAYMNYGYFDLAEKDFLVLKKTCKEEAEEMLKLNEQKQREKDKSEKKVFKSVFLTNHLYEANSEVKQEVNDYSNMPLASNPKVFFHFVIGKDTKVQRVEFELFKDKLPKTAENFRQLCTGQMGGKFSYKNSIIHKVVFKGMIQGGDFENFDGSGGCSIYGRKFEDEGFFYKHTKEGLLSMANSGPNSNNSQFFITLNEMSWLDGKHVVFGRVIKGMDTIKDIELVDVDKEDKPTEEIKIVDCGEF